MPQVRLYRYEHAGRNDLIRVNVTYRTGVIVAPSFNVGWFALYTKALRLHMSPGVSVLFLRNNRSIENYALSTSEFTELSTVFAVNFQAGAVFADRFMITGYASLPARINRSIAYSGEHQSLQVTAGIKF
jgi:uncharacterized membrane protein YciS (DUF1049 family)